MVTLRKRQQKILIACSGGPDSMFLLNRFKHLNPVVAHLNYSLREESDSEEKIVKEFCAKHQLTLEILRLQNPSPQGNFQNWARRIRYNFFQKCAQKHQLTTLWVAHTKDDFVESGLLNRPKEKFFSSIPKESSWGSLKIERPLLFRFWKSQILKSLIKNNISFGQDSSNFKDIYSRNRLRKELASKPQIYKRLLFWKYFFLDLKNKFFFKKSVKIFSSWESQRFSLALFRDLSSKEKIRQLILFLRNFDFFDDQKRKNQVKFSQKKLEGIVSFLQAKNHKTSFRISKDFSLLKTHLNTIKIVEVSF